VVINELDGSGKTLAYLLPVINRILTTKKVLPALPKSGAIIITLNKEISLGIYRLIRMLDFDNLLSVNRSGSLTHYSPIVEEMVI
jgi:superfamily II DNA/RNA helicase